jgi:cell division protein FtsN
VPEPPPQAAPAAAPSAAPVAEGTSPNADTQPATPTETPTRVAAVAPPKPAKAHRAAPQPAALPSPPTAHSNAAGPFRVQFGAFAQEDNAHRLQSAIEATGLKVEVRQEPGPSGHSLFFVRSPVYPDYASALNAAQTAQSRAQHSANAIAITYTIRADHSAPEQRAQTP